MANDASREGGDPPNTQTKRRSRRLTGPVAHSLRDLSLILLIYLSDEMGLNGPRDRERNARWLHASIMQWRRLYVAKPTDQP